MFIHKDIFACLFSIHNIISLSCHEQVSLTVENELKEQKAGFLDTLNLLVNDVYSRNNLPKTKGTPYVTNLDEYKSIKTHWIALNLKGVM